MGSLKSTADEVALLLHQVSLPAARRDYELRSSSPAPTRSAASSSSQLVSRAFQNARAMSFNAAKDVPFVLHQAPNQRVFFSGPLGGSSHGTSHPILRAAAPREQPEPENDPIVPSDQSSRNARRDRNALSGLIDRSSDRIIPGPPRRTQSGDLRASKSSTTVSYNRPRSSELMRASWCPSEDVKVEEKKRGESRRRPTASIAWDSLNEGSQANSPQHELAAIPFQWEEAPGKPLAMSRVSTVREDSTTAAAKLASSTTRDREAPVERAQSHRFYSRAASQCEQLPRKSSFDAASAAHLISEVVSSTIDLVAPAAAKFLVESWVSPAAAPEAHVAVPFQWEEAPGVPKLDAEPEGAANLSQEAVKPVTVPLQLPPRLASPVAPALSKEEMRGRLRTRSMSGPLAGYYPHTSPARRRQLQHSPIRRSSSPSSKRSISPSRIAHHFTSSHRSKRDSAVVLLPPHSSLTASLEAELRDTAGSTAGGYNYGAGLGRSASGVLLSEHVRSPWRYQRSVSPSRRIHALAKQLTCKIRPAKAILVKTDPWSPTSMNLSGPSSSNSDMDASGQTPVSEVAFSKSFSRVSYESFRSHSFAHRAAAGAMHSPSRSDEANGCEAANSASSEAPGSPYLGPLACEDVVKARGSGGAAEGVKAVVKMCRTGSSALLRKKATPQTSAADMWAPTLASYFRCLEAATMISNRTRTPVANTEPTATAAEAVAVQTRLPYTMPVSSVEQNLLWKEYCESPNQTDFRTPCLGVTLSPAKKFISRGKKFPAPPHNQWSSIPTTSAEDGYRSPAYAATLELLSPSAELFRKKKRIVLGSSSRGIKLVMPSTRRRTQIMEAVCTSLKRALYKCAKRCCRKASSPPPLNAAQTRYTV